VLKDLPNKTERIEWCDMTELQRSIYMEALQRSRKTVLDAETSSIDTPTADTPPTNGHSKAAKKKARPNARPKDKMYLENSSNVLMDLRKAASHPMLFRKRFTDDILAGITKQLLKEPDFKKRGALYDLVKEDMTVMTDAELQVFCATYKVSWSNVPVLAEIHMSGSQLANTSRTKLVIATRVKSRCS
jgi:SWI/SNF-related matrix-associated actin-dependent regulator of chromatin subfamily A containing DEAD/H box 1